MQHLEEGQIHEWLDGELSAEEAAVLEAHVAECADCAAVVAEARGLIAASSRIVGALDIVPGDVIPAGVSGQRAWYLSPQFRAAAAVLLVAGASLVLIRRELSPDMERSTARVLSAPDVAEVHPPTTPMPNRAEAAQDAGIVPQESQPLRTKASPRPFLKQSASGPAVDVLKQRAKGVPNEIDLSREAAGNVADNAASLKALAEERVLEGKVAGAQITSVPPAAASPMAMQKAPPPSKLRPSPKSLDEAPISGVVVTGVATATAAPARALLREVKSDTTATAVMTVYEVSPGVQVTLVEPVPGAFAPRQADARRKEATGNAAIVPLAAVPPTTTRIETVTWTNTSTGRLYTLTGPLSNAQLTALRGRLPPAKR